MTYIKINETFYPALSISGKVTDRDWDGRASKAFTLEMEYDLAATLFVDGASWSIVTEDVVDGETVTEEHDNSDYNVAGDITDHRDGTMTIQMGKPTDLEEAYELLYGGM